MKILFASITIVTGLLLLFVPFAESNQADDTTITITGKTPGATPFISKLTLAVSNTAVLKSIQFTIDRKPGSVTRPVSGTYSNDYLVSRGFEHPPEIILPVYGLYDGYANIVRLTYRFLDGSSKHDVTAVTTATFDDPCGYKHPTILQARTNSRDLSYDYIMAKGSCSDFSPAIIDTDGALRWVGTGGFSVGSAIFFDNAVYLGHGAALSRIDLDGTVTLLGDYHDAGIFMFTHNIDRGKFGLILEADTTQYYNSTNIEVDAHSGHILKVWNMTAIISAAMRAGGDDPSQFVYSSRADWWHGNAATYNRADDSVIISSRENFLICLDYETNAIKWILGDPTKAWYQYPSLRKFALTLAPGSLPPIGQHAVSLTFDQNLLVLDNGAGSIFHRPTGDHREYASPRKYRLDLVAKTATEVWNYPMNQSIHCPYCSSVYEDAPFNYLIDYSIVNNGLPGRPTFAQLLGLNAAGETIFSYRYPATNCGKIYRALPIHLENTKFPTVEPKALNLSTRGTVTTGDNVLINGFIISGRDPATIVVRALGPSLAGFGLSGVLADPVLNLYNSSGVLVKTNDNWHDDFGFPFMQAIGLAPSNPSESAALLRNLLPGAYTVVVTGKNSTEGVSLAEVYDLSPQSNSKLANISGRGYVGTGDNVLINGFIIGDVDSATVVVRALGPSLGRFGVSNPLSDPILTIYDSKGSAIATNDNWHDNSNFIDIRRHGLSPPNALDSAIVLHLPAGKYTAVVSGANGATGNALVEVYDLD